jgi:hypothetical protein
VPYSGGDGLTRRVGETASRYDSQVVSEGRHGADSSLTWVPTCVRTLNALVGGGGGCKSGEPVRASSEAESRPMGRLALERGGVSTAQCPSSETEFRPKGAGRTVLVGR